jgi:hypothetical protein
MSAVEGGAFRCDIHLDKNGKGFTTASIDEYNHHCLTTEGHREEGQTYCIDCGELVNWSTPFKPLAHDGSKGIGPISCDDCAPDNKDKDIQVQKVEVQVQQPQAKIQGGKRK